jgi:hypothetical protein
VPFAVTILVAVLFPGTASAQGVLSVDVGLGVDLEEPAWSRTGWHPAVPEILEAWEQYLLSDAHLQAPTSLWSTAEQESWPGYDLTAGLAYIGTRATVLDIRPRDAATPDEFVVSTLFTSLQGSEQRVRPVALTRVFAVREEGRWVFSGAIHRLTEGWSAETVGSITFRFPADYPFDRAGAEGAVTFADSLSAALELPPLEDVTYFVARSPDELHRMMGLDWTLPGMGHGYALPWNRLLLNGNPDFGEANRHELTHLVLGPVLGLGRTHGAVNEGMATWLGGSMGMTFSEVIREYAAYLRDHPATTLDAVLAGRGPDRGIVPAGTLFEWSSSDPGD